MVSAKAKEWVSVAAALFGIAGVAIGGIAVILGLYLAVVFLVALIPAFVIWLIWNPLGFGQLEFIPEAIRELPFWTIWLGFVLWRLLIAGLRKVTRSQ